MQIRENIGDHPAIQNALATGFSDGVRYWPHCPVCGEECDTLYIDRYGEVFGCEECVETRDAWETHACFADEGGAEYGDLPTLGYA